jgi:uracil-DNA glycosylase
MNSHVPNNVQLTDSRLAIEFSQIVACESCTSRQFPNLQRDYLENVPQPGYIGMKYSETGVMLAGQNPGVCPERFARADARYTAALRKLRDRPCAENFQELRLILDDFVPTWPIHGTHFPLRESNLSLDQIAYCNVIRCRTRDNSKPSELMAKICIETHFEHWLDMLNPKIVVFLGKWAHDQALSMLVRKRIPTGFINRMRSLNSAQRAANRREIVDLILRETGS